MVATMGMGSVDFGYGTGTDVFICEDDTVYYGTVASITYINTGCFVIPDCVIPDLSWYRKFDPVIKKHKPHKLIAINLVKPKPLRLCARNR
jgi:hypothetical protein